MVATVPQKFTILDPFGKSRQQGGVDIKWNGPEWIPCRPDWISPFSPAKDLRPPKIYAHQRFTPAKDLRQEN